MAVRVASDGPVTTVINDRFEARNAVDPATAQALVAAFEAFEADPAAAVAVFWGAGGAFCAGWDLKHGAATAGAWENANLAVPDDATAALPRGPMGPTRLRLSKPVIAAVEGPAVAGGMELALWCDLRVMASDAYFGVYCRRWGVPLVDGGTVRLPRLVGLGRALDIILTGRKVTAEEAHRIGLCERVVAPGAARAEAEALAHRIAGFPQGCLRADRRSAIEGMDLDFHAALAGEWRGGSGILAAEGAEGAARFAAGRGRHGEDRDI